MKDPIFRFKQFAVRHSLSSMKIGVDAVLTGCLADLQDATRVLDAGCGCGVIALICAQRAPQAQIEAIDVHESSVAEAAENFSNSPWRERLSAYVADFLNLHEQKYSHIISNPPYYDAGLAEFGSSRERARHVSEFSPESLLRHGSELLLPGGSIIVITPCEWMNRLHEAAHVSSLHLSRCTQIKGHAAAPVKRIVTQWQLGGNSEPEYNTLVLEEERGVPTFQYWKLTQDFYLRDKHK